MRTARRDFLKAAGSVGVLSSIAVNRCSAQTSKASDHVNDPTTAEIEFYELGAEPFVSSSYPVHEQFDSGMSDQLVVITARGLERVDWDVRPEKNCWLLRLPEMAFVDGARWDYQAGMDWQHQAGGCGYQSCPMINHRQSRWYQEAS